ncbi:DMT family transporter [Prochlorococcus sp. MIT 0601]|uniref:DMT family transporter n=1 Tax=Prochlorococcus sp. MIT 0601 TaxID=1499498 RepID=UPI0005339658|nr:DMT family transporter [Prochlorococcus sp. MIT 0601]KGG12064.1 Permease of the drug/metabolite transporter (DMT) [Prochlorococcus sp. MIT 0601]
MFEMFNWLLMILPFALWGTAMAAMAPLVQSGGPEIVAFLRLFPAGVAVLCTLVILKRTLKIAKSDLGWFVVFTLVDATFFQFLLARGLLETGAGLGSVFIDSQPLMVAVLARSLFGDAINPFGWAGLMLGLVGIICLGVSPGLLRHWLLMGDAVSGGNLFSNGQGWMLAAAIAMALGTVLIRFTCKESDPVAVTGWHMTLGSFPLIIWHYFDSNWSFWPDWTVVQWGFMAYASLFGSALAYGLFFWFANKKELTSFSTLAFLTPVFALLSGGIWLGERLESLQWIGVALVLVSVFLVSQRNRLWIPFDELSEENQRGI